MEAFQQAIAERVAAQHRHHGKSQFLWVWGALLAMTAIEVYLTYQNMQPVRMLTILMGLSLVKAALIIGYFMHMKYEVSRMKWLTMCSLARADDDFLPGRASHPFAGREMRFRVAILAACLLLWATPAFSQACSMCYSTAKATSKDGQRAISRGVIVLLVPPFGFMTLGIWMAFRYGRKRDREQTDHVNLEL